MYKDAKFHSAEQLYQYKRAERANNKSLALDILMTRVPVECKSLSKDLPEDRNTDIQIMREVIELKFRKEPFKSELTKTGEATLMECNPYDKF